MPYSIEVRTLAAIEIVEAYDWYEAQREGLGTEFLEELELFYQSLLQNPDAYSYYKKPVRQGKIPRFPYLGPFEIFEFTIVIYSVFMSKQNPDKKRIQ